MKIVLAIFFTLVFSIIGLKGISQVKPVPKSTSSPKSPLPPPSPSSPQSPGSINQATALKVSTKQYMEKFLLTMMPTGNKEHDYLQSMMFLQYRSIDVADKEFDEVKAVNVINSGKRVFDEAMELMHKLPKDSTGSNSNSLPLNFTSIATTNQIQEQILSLSAGYKTSGNDPKVLAFADRMISQTKKQD